MDQNKSSADSSVIKNQPYDESLLVPDADEVASVYTPSPRRPGDSQGSMRQLSQTNSQKMSGSEDFDDNQQEFQSSDSQRPLQPTFDTHRDREADNEASASESEEDDEDDDEDDSEESGMPLGAYDPTEFENLNVSTEIKDLFEHIGRYTPQSIELEHKLKPFIPEYIPAVGDIDAFIKIPRVDGKSDELGLVVVDEPSSKQSDSSVLDLMLRQQLKQTTDQNVKVHSIVAADRNTKAIDNWIKNIGDLQKMKAPPVIEFSNQIDIDSLMQEWPANFEELLKEVQLPSADLNCSLEEYVDIICAILDIPIQKSRIQSLHTLFTLYSEFKNSEHFKALAGENKLDNSLKTNVDKSDHLVL